MGRAALFDIRIGKSIALDCMGEKILSKIDMDPIYKGGYMRDYKWKMFG